MHIALTFKSHSQPAKLMQPTQRAFDDPSIYSQATAMGSAPLCQHWRDVEASSRYRDWRSDSGNSRSLESSSRSREG